MKTSFLRHCLGLLLLGVLWAPGLVLAQQVSQVLLDVQGKLDEGDIKLDDGGLLDIYEIEIKENSPIFISAESDEFDSYLLMLDSDENKVGESNTSDGRNVGILLEDIKPGKYEIGVMNYKRDENGKYRLLVKIPTSAELISLQANFLFNQARNFQQEGSSSSLLKAIDYYEASLVLYRQIENTSTMGIILNKIGNLYFNLGNRKKALDYYQQALIISKQVGNLHKEGLNLNGIGVVYAELGDQQKALDYFNQSLAISQQMENLEGQTSILNNIGMIYSNLGNMQKALGYYSHSLAISQQINDLLGQGTNLNNVGMIYLHLGDKNKALDYLNQALVINKKIENLSGQGTNLNNIGMIYSGLGDTQKGLDYYNQSLVISKQLGDLSGEGTNLNNIGMTYFQLGDYQKALDYFNQALVISKQIGDLYEEGTILNNIGGIYSDLGDYQKKLDYLNQALVIHKQLGNLSGEATTLNNIGGIYSDLGDYQKSLGYLNQALTIRRQTGDLSGEATTLNNIGVVYSALEDKEKALVYYNQSLIISRKTGDLLEEGTILNNIGGTYSNLGDYKKALDYLNQALVIKNQVEDLSGQARTLGDLGYLQLKNKQYDDAVKYSSQAIELLESVDIKGLSDELQVSYFDTYVRGYQLLQKAFITQNQPAEAMTVAERGRGRVLVELLNQRFVKTGDISALGKPTVAELQAVAKQSNSALVTYSLIEDLRGPNGEKEDELYIYLISPNQPLQFRSVNLTDKNIDLNKLVQGARQVVTQPPGDSTQTNRGNNSGVTYSVESLMVGDYVKLQGEFPTDEPWQITAINREQKTVSLDQTRREQPLENVSIDRIASKTDTSLRQLHQILIEPIADLLPQDPTKKVIFMPQGALFGVPFAALQNAQGQYLIEKHTILTSPSIQVLGQTASQNQRLRQQPLNVNNALIVGNPYPYPGNLKSLENASAEAQQIANLLGVSALLGKNATKAQILAQMPQAEIIHLATHASFNDQNGIRSAIYLTAEPGTPDDGLFQTPGRITAEDIFNQFAGNALNARLVVLSACDTGQGEITGDGVIGLSRSLIAAGVPSVLVSLWSVDDASTKTLMTDFYRQWQQQGTDKATALRNAMLQTKATYPDPYYWSGFTLIGEAD